ncbi:hypothetical protein NKR19_g4138 [Coniochaeta hoffmannii]|uniref:Ecp2 effector protein-like domain-containing protein n=1 Tax=Coniochaeta hoffmannii TaxID=91930 RepID=A0AA38SE63_9PEZI|nr:hypothetical protein NKR19_g4138 [Coniochaeta hoffmannii]
MALPTDHHNPVENMIPRQFTAPDGTPSTVYVNRNLNFISSPDSTASTKLSRRTVQFTPGTRNDYCSETTPDETFGSDAPLAADCLAIKDYMETIRGHYTVSPGDFINKSGWAVIASSGTCSFGVKFQLAADTKQVVIGTNDVHFYINGYARDARGGKIQAVGTISCNNDGQLLLLFWGMIHS